MRRASDCQKSCRRLVAVAASVLAASLAASGPAIAERITIGMVKIAASAPVFIAEDKGYFAGEGLDAELAFFDNAQTIAMGVASNSLDFGATAVSGGFYSLAAQGIVKIIGGTNRDMPGFHQYATVVSNRASAAGLASYRDLAGHSMAIVQIGGPIHYTVALVAEKFGIDLKTVRLLPLQTLSNQVAAVTGGQADAGIIPATLVLPSVERGDMKLLGFTGDEVQWQGGALFAATATIDARRDLVERFLRAYRQGAQDYHDAFTTGGEKRQDGPGAAAVLALIARHVGQTPEQIAQGLPFIDGAVRIDRKDVQHQLDWYRAQGMLKTDVSAADVIDKRFAVPLP